MRLLLLLPTLFLSFNCYKILVYNNLFGHSHIKFVAKVADTLTDAGHDVIVLMPVVDPSQRNRTALVTTKKQIFVEPDGRVVDQMKATDKFLSYLWTSETSNPIKMWWNSGSLTTLFGAQCEKVMKDTELLQKLKAENFDLAVNEPFDSCGYYITEYLQIPSHISVLSGTRMDHVSYALGQPVAASYIPGTQSVYGEKMNMFERFMNLLQFFSGNAMFSVIGDYEFQSAKKILGVTRSWREILPESSFVMTNHVPVLEFPAPTFDKIIPIGGITVQTDWKKLAIPEPWDTMMNMRKKNVLISFGSNVKSKDMPDEFKKSLIKVFLEVREATFLWKYENLTEKITCDVLNVNRGEWLPQNEILADPRLDAFITHGGLASITEVAMMGKPAVIIPIFADQTRNAEMLKRHGGVEVLHKSDIANPKKVAATLRKVMEDPSYRANAERLAGMLNNAPTDPKEVLVKHVEFAARFGKLPSMDPHGRHQSLIEYYLLDILFIAVFSIFMILYATVKIVLFVCGCGKRKVKFE